MIVKPSYNDDEYYDIGLLLPDAGHQEHRGTHVLTPQSLPEQVLHHAPEQRHRIMLTEQRHRVMLTERP